MGVERLAACSSSATVGNPRCDAGAGALPGGRGCGRWRRFRGVGHPTRCPLALKAGLHTRDQVFECHSPLVGTTYDHRRDTFPPLLTRRAACPVGHPPINRHQPNGLLREIVARWDARCRDERDEAFKVIAEAIAQIGSLVVPPAAYEGLVRPLVAAPPCLLQAGSRPAETCSGWRTDRDEGSSGTASEDVPAAARHVPYWLGSGGRPGI